MHILGNQGSDDGIYLKQTDGSAPRTSTIHNISIKNVGRDGIRFDAYSYIHIYDVIVQSAGQDGYHIVDDTINPLQEYLLLELCRANASKGSGLRIETGSLMYFKQCDFAFNDKGVFISGGVFAINFDSLSIAHNITYGIEIFADTSHITRLSFRDTFIHMKGVDIAEKAIYTHRDDGWVITNVYFDWLEINKNGATIPTTSVDIDTTFAYSGLRYIRNASGGAIKLPNTQPFDFIDTYKIGVYIFDGNDATPSVSGGKVFKTANNATTTITMFDNGHAGQKITIIFNDAKTTVDFTNTNLKGNGGVDWTPKKETI